MAQHLWSRVSTALSLVLSCGACASSYAYLQYSPTMQEAELRDTNELEARAVIAWQGLYAGDNGSELRFRVRIENPRDVPFPLAPATFALVDGALTPFGPARVELPAAVDPRQDVTFDVAFPVPPGRIPEEFDLSALNLRIRLQDGRLSWSTNFQRLMRSPYYAPYYGYYNGPYWGPYWGSSWSFHGAVVFCHH